MSLHGNLYLDIHTHTIASGHAFGTIRENAQAGAEHGLKLVGTSEHGPSVKGSCGLLYFASSRRIPRELFGVEVITGVEANLLDDGSIDIPEKLYRCLDYIMVGIHIGSFFSDHGIDGNTDLLIRSMQIEKVHFIAHPDTDKNPVDYDRLAKAASENRVALELNNSSLRKPYDRPGCYENYRKMLKACEKYGTFIVVSSDAHDPGEVGRFERAEALLEECQFPESLILNCDVARFKQFIDYDYDRVLPF